MGKLSTKEIASNIQTLLASASSKDVRADAARLDDLRRAFTDVKGDMQAPLAGSSLSETQQKWRAFLKSAHASLIHQLCDRIRGDDANETNHVASSSSVQSRQQQHPPPPPLYQVVSATRTLCAVIASTPARSANEKYKMIDCAILLRLWEALPVALDDHKSLCRMLRTEFLTFRDVQYYTLTCIVTMADQQYKRRKEDDNNDELSQAEVENSVKLVQLLRMIPFVGSQAELKSGSYLFPPDDAAIPDDTDDESDSSSESDEDDQHRRPNKRTRAPEFGFRDYRQHRVSWTKAWLAVLRLPLPETTLKSTLRFLPKAVLPVATTPLRFSDFFMNAYSSNNTSNSSVTSILALEGLFTLMTQHGLEYPNFYKQLYKLVRPNVTYLQHKGTFLLLLARSLSRNEMLPAHLVAAFCKRLLRTALSAPPGPCLFLLALVSNLLRQHPETSCLIHRTTTNCDWNKNDRTNDPPPRQSMLSSSDDDPFDAETDHPEDARALQSSLWELHALAEHYYPAVGTLARSVGTVAESKAPWHSMEDFAVLTYGGLFEQERNKRQRTSSSKTPLAFREPRALFGKDDIFYDILAGSR